MTEPTAGTAPESTAEHPADHPRVAAVKEELRRAGDADRCASGGTSPPGPVRAVRSVAVEAEAALLDSIFIADVLGPYSVYGGSAEAAIRRGMERARVNNVDRYLALIRGEAAAREELISRSAKLAYPIRDGIPIMWADQARKIEPV